MASPSVPLVGKLYVTKYAFTRGILEFVDVGYIFDGYWNCRIGKYRYFIGPRDYFRTLEEAEKRVWAMVAAQKKSLKKQLAALENYEVTVRPGLVVVGA